MLPFVEFAAAGTVAFAGIAGNPAVAVEMVVGTTAVAAAGIASVVAFETVQDSFSPSFSLGFYLEALRLRYQSA